MTNGCVAQLARAFGSYPTGRWFESVRSHQVAVQGPMVKWSRHHPFTVVSWVRIPLGSPNWNYPNTTITKQWVRVVFLLPENKQISVPSRRNNFTNYRRRNNSSNFFLLPNAGAALLLPKPEKNTSCITALSEAQLKKPRTASPGRQASAAAFSSTSNAHFFAFG